MVFDKSPAAALARLRRAKAGELMPDVYAGSHFNNEHHAVSSDRAVLADAYDREHPADDAEPIDAAWLASAGFAEDARNGGEWLRLIPGGCPGDTNRVVAFDSNGGVCLECCNAAGESTEVVSLAPCPTRGQLRRLLAALGVPAAA